MGEIADMMLDGFLDEETGEYIDGDSPGFPRRMSDPDMYSAQPVSRTPAEKAARRAKNKRKRDRQKANRDARKNTSPAA